MRPSRPRAFCDSTRRAFLADLTRPTNTRLANIKPGSDPELSQVVAGSHVVFAVDVQGIRPRNVLLHFSVDGGKFFAVREFAPGRHQYDPWQVTYTNAQQSMDYYLTGGDAESERYHLEVLPAPTITSISHDLDVPQVHQARAAKRHRGGNRSGDRRDQGHRSCQDQHAGGDRDDQSLGGNARRR